MLMSLEHCAAVLNRFNHSGRSQWTAALDHVGSEDPHEWLSPFEARAITYMYEHNEIHELVGIGGVPCS